MKRLFKIICICGIVLFCLILILYLNGFRSYKYAHGAESMHPTLSPGDICLCIMSESYRHKKIDSGTIVLIHHKSYNYLLTKRVIARENDIISIYGTETRINGILFTETYALYSNSQRDTLHIDSIKIARDKFFVMGDNRTNSLDSRNPGFGLIDIQDIKGRPLIILWSHNVKKIFKTL